MARCGWCGRTDVEYGPPDSRGVRMLKTHSKPKKAGDAGLGKTCTGMGEDYSGHLTMARSS